MEMSFQHYFLGLFAVANNIPAIPLFISLCRNLNKQEQHKLCFIASFTSFATMVLAMLVGSAILNFFDISIDAFRMAGGILLLISGLNMVNSKSGGDESHSGVRYSEVIPIAVIPVAIPLTTGAGTISTVILFAHSVHSLNHFLKLFGAITATISTVYVIFYFSPTILRFLGHTGMEVLTKIFGLITLALGIQFILTGVTHVFPRLVN